MEAPADVITHRVPRAGLTRQIIVSLMVSLAPLNAGMIVGWLSPMSLKLMSDESPVGVMTKEEISTLASIAFYGLMVYAFALGYVSDRYGRKPALLMVGFPNIISGTIMTFATSKAWLYIGRMLSGLRSNGIFMSGMYISETVDETIRGMMITLCSVQINLGILISYTAGKFLNYHVFNAITIVLPGLFTFLMLCLPETPVFLSSQGRDEEAKKALLWLNGDHTSVVAQHELEAMMKSKPNDEFISNLSLAPQGLAEAYKTRGARRALIISVSLFALQMFSGIHVVLNYAGILFKEAGSPLSPEDSSIVTAIIILVSSIINLVIVDRLGRKTLLYVSFISGGACTAILSIFLYIKLIGVDVSNFGWIPISSIGVFVFSHGIGLSSLPGVIMNEVCPPNIKPAVLAVNTVSMVLCITIVLQSFPYLDKYIGLYSTFAIPSFVNLIGVVFTKFMIPETRCKPLAHIYAELNRK